MSSITTDMRNDVLVISIQGSFDLSCFEQFHQSYPSDISHISSIEVNLGQTNEIDSSSMGMLVSLWKIMGEQKGKVRVVNASQSIKELLEIGRIGDFVDIL